MLDGIRELEKAFTDGGQLWTRLVDAGMPRAVYDSFVTIPGEYKTFVGKDSYTPTEPLARFRIEGDVLQIKCLGEFTAKRLYENWHDVLVAVTGRYVLFVDDKPWRPVNRSVKDDEPFWCDMSPMQQQALRNRMYKIAKPFHYHVKRAYQIPADVVFETDPDMVLMADEMAKTAMGK